MIEWPFNVMKNLKRYSIYAFKRFTNLNVIRLMRLNVLQI